AVTLLAHVTDAVAADGWAADVRRTAAAAGLREGARATVEGAAAAIGNHPAVRALGGTCGGGAAADVRRAAAAAGLREGARATVGGAAAAVGNRPAVRAHGGACGGGAARAGRLLASRDAYPAAAAGAIGPTRLALRYAGRTCACDTPSDDDERGGEHRHEERDT